MWLRLGGLSGGAGDGARGQVDPKRVLGVASGGRVGRLDLADDLRVGLLERVQDTPGAVRRIALDSQRLLGPGRRLVLGRIAGVQVREL